MYKRQTVYPESQTCAHGVLLSAGAMAQNLTESQYGLASVKFRWNQMCIRDRGYFAYTTGSVMNIDGGFTLSRL